MQDFVRLFDVNLVKLCISLVYRLNTDYQWCYLLMDGPHWQTVATWIWMGWRDGQLPAVHNDLRRQVREQVGKVPDPSGAIINSRSVKITVALKIRISGRWRWSNTAYSARLRQSSAARYDGGTPFYLSRA